MFDRQAAERSEQAWVTTHRGLIACAAGAAVLGAAVLARR
jgi:hypothetical protein